MKAFMKRGAALALAAIIAFDASTALAWCGPFTMSGWYPIGAGPADNNTGQGMVNGLGNLNLFNGWSFNNILPVGTTAWITQMKIQTKGVNYQTPPVVIPAPSPAQGQTVTLLTRNSYFVLNGIWTCTDREGSCDFIPPMALPAQFNFSNGQLINNSVEGQNMIIMVQGFWRDATCPWPQAVQGIPAGY